MVIVAKKEDIKLRNVFRILALLYELNTFLFIVIHAYKIGHYNLSVAVF